MGGGDSGRGSKPRNALSVCHAARTKVDRPRKGMDSSMLSMPSLATLKSCFPGPDDIIIIINDNYDEQKKRCEGRRNCLNTL